MALFMALIDWLEFVAFVLEMLPWLWATLVAIKIPTALLVALLDLMHLHTHHLVKVGAVINFMLFAVVPPPLLMASFVILLRRMVVVIVMMEALRVVVHFAMKMPETPHLGACVMAHVVSMRALAMASDDVLHCCTL